jgi:hypothetical protein
LKVLANPFSHCENLFHMKTSYNAVYDGMYKYVLVCMSMYMYWYVLVCTDTK